jgi:hypothetical protein
MLHMKKPKKRPVVMMANVFVSEMGSLLVVSRVTLVWTAGTTALGLLWNGLYYSFPTLLLWIGGIAACLYVFWVTSGKRLRDGSISQVVITGFCVIVYVAFAYVIWTESASSIGKILLLFYAAAFVFSCFCKFKNVVVSRES